MVKNQFRAESKRLLDLMINSIYTHKEIFLRELISNASDAIDKSYYHSLSDENTVFNKEDFYIRITPNKEKRTLAISDSGIGMTRDELENNLGTIAKSGSLAFKQENESKDGVDIIGQFGVGFYSAFMVAENVTVISKSADGQAYKWESSGADGYTIEPCEKAEQGTEIILTIKPNTDDENYDEFLDEYRLKALIKKYSDFIKYPIKMEVSKSRPKPDTEGEYEQYSEDETLNSMVPIWRKNKSELKAEDYEAFYRDKHYGFDKPLKYAHMSVDGLASFNAILYIPSKTPFDFYTREYQKGLELYSNGVMIMNKCADLLPDYFSFVQGLVDSADLSLNISRELLQHDRQLQIIAKRIKERIKKELLAMQENDREKYEEFFASFGKTIKFGVYDGWGANKEFLEDLLMFYSSTEKKLVSLSEYVSRMKPGQEYIYYAAGESTDKIAKLPQIEPVADKGYEILYLTEEVDEFALKMMVSYKEKNFQSVSDADVSTEDEQKENEQLAEQNKDMLDAVKEVLGKRIKQAKVSARLKTHPVCLSSEGEMSIEMEKVLKSMPGSGDVKAEKVLELNPAHDVFAKLKSAYEGDRDRFEKLASVLYNQALLIEGLAIEDPVQYANDICDLLG